MTRSTSKKQSAQKDPGQPEPVFFTDRDLGKTFPGILRQNGLVVVTYFEAYPDDDRVPDVTWIRTMGRKRLVLLTKDDAVRRDEEAIGAIMDTRAVLVIVRHPGTASEAAEKFLEVRRHVARLTAKARKRQEGVIAAVRRRVLRGAREQVVLETWLWAAEWERRGRRLVVSDLEPGPDR